MKLGRFEVCYCEYKKSAYQQAKEEMAKCTIAETRSIITGATFIMLYYINEINAKLNVKNFTEKVESKGNDILDLIQIIGYFTALVFAGIDIVKSFKKQDLAGIIAIAVKYSVAVGILYGLPDIFDLFKDLFE